MLKKEVQSMYFNKRWNVMLRHMFTFVNSKDPEELHKMRIEIKKIFAILVFNKSCLNKFKFSKHFIPLKELYKFAEPIRNAQVNLQIIDRYNFCNLELYNEQTKALLSQIKIFCANHQVYFLKIQDVYDSLPDIFSGIDNKCILKFYRKNIKKLSVILNDNNIESKLHEFRKNIKLLIFLSEFIPKTILNKLGIDFTYLDRLQENIGEWHDIVTISDLVMTRDFKTNEAIVKLENLRKKAFFNINSQVYNFNTKINL
jgi:CHAD domain-containing protein